MPQRQLAIQKAALDAGRFRPVMLAIAGDIAGAHQLILLYHVIRNRSRLPEVSTP